MGASFIWPHRPLSQGDNAAPWTPNAGYNIFESLSRLEDKHVNNRTDQRAVATNSMPSTPELTAVRATSKAMATTNEGCDAKWITLNRLPGFMWEAIRAMGETIFSPLTNTPLSNIEVIANLAGHGPHTQQDIDITANRLRQATAPSKILEYSTDQMKDLFGMMYEAQAVQFEDTKYAYLLVKDHMGNYIYRWPAADTNRRFSRLGSVQAITE